MGKTVPNTMPEIEKNTIIEAPPTLRMPVILPKNSLNMEEDGYKVEELLKGQGIL